jgi:hypothetical protein
VLELMIWWRILGVDEAGAYLQIKTLPPLSLVHKSTDLCTKQWGKETTGIHSVDVPKLIFWWHNLSDGEIGTYLPNYILSGLFLW